VPPERQVELTPPFQLAIRRSRISVEILKRPSDNNTKYDLFQRLNAGGTQANAQELRNCIIIMVSGVYAHFLRELANYPNFRTVLAASEDQLETQRDMEYATRFLVHTYVNYDRRLDVEEFIDESIVALASAGETQIAGQTFRVRSTCSMTHMVRMRCAASHMARPGGASSSRPLSASPSASPKTSQT
jgi:hypothetical protein